MKKIIIVNNNMKVGGVQKSLYNLLWAIHDTYDVTLCVFQAVGAYLPMLPANVKIVECKGLFRYLALSQGECRGIGKIIRGMLALTSKLVGRNVAMKIVMAGEKKMPEHYDCAIAFLHNGNIKHFYGGVQDFVLEKVNADRKIAFLHCDYATSGANHPQNNKMLERFDRIAACSDGCRQAFSSVLPHLAEKTVTVRNFHRYDQIRALAEQDPVAYDANVRNVVMVSRLSHEKGIERAIRAMAHVVQQGIVAALHIVGGGPMEAFLKETVAEQGMQGSVFFYGEQENPYRYMKNADLFLMSSFHEAAPMVIDEAMCLHVPVLTVQTTSSHEMVTMRNGGWVCQNSEGALLGALIEALSDPVALQTLRETLSGRRANNDAAAEEFSKVIEG